MQPPDELHDVLTAIPTAILDMRYATPHNFTGQQLYAHQIAWLRQEPLRQLNKAAVVLADDGFSIVIFDAFRPQSVQKILRQHCNDSDYVLEVSNHCRGITVDITLADAQGVYLDMGSDYDDFSPRAHLDFTGLSEQQRTNRALLQEVMVRHDFIQHPYEWWHFDYQPTQHWPLIDDDTIAFK